MKRKDFALMGIAVVLCSMLLVALPAIAAEQTTHEVSAAGVTTASEDEFVLGIYGNANEDDTIDMRDVTYTKLVIFGKKPETKLADAYYDDEVDVLDVVQTKLIILGRESELTLVDSADRIVTVKKPINKIVPTELSIPEVIRTLGATDKLVAIDHWTSLFSEFFPELMDLPVIGDYYYGLDYEKIFELEPDIVISYYGAGSSMAEQPSEIADKLEPVGIELVCFQFYEQNIYVGEVKKLGYILDKRDRAEEFIEFFQDDCMDIIKERTEGLSEVDKPRVYLEYTPITYHCTPTAGQDLDQMCEIAGGINIAADLPGKYPKVDSEWVIAQNPDIIIKSVYQGSVSCGFGEDDTTEMRELWGKITSGEDIYTGWEVISAVKNEKVYLQSSDIYGGPSGFVGTAYYAKWIQPDLFDDDLDPKAIYQKYLTEFQGLDYDLDEHGVFVYHPKEHPDGK